MYLLRSAFPCLLEPVQGFEGGEPRGHSQTTFTAMGGGGVDQMSILINK